MMQVYQLGRDANRYRWLSAVREEDFDALVGRPNLRRATWTPIYVEYLNDKLNRKLPKGDFPTFGTVPTFTQKAVDVLFDILVENGELLPLTSAEGPFYVFNVTRVVDALDKEQSDLKRFSDGTIMRVVRYAFDPQAIGELSIFRVPELPTEFVTQRFVDRVESAGLKGFAFSKIWQAPNGTAS